jgi:hypothetical protein
MAAVLDKGIRDGLAISFGEGIDDSPWGDRQRAALPQTEAIEHLTSAFVERRDHPTSPMDSTKADQLTSLLVGLRNDLSFDRDAFPVMTSLDELAGSREELAAATGDSRLKNSWWPLLLHGKEHESDRTEFMQKAAVLVVFSAQAGTLPERRKWFRYTLAREEAWLELHAAMASGDAAKAESLLKQLAPQGKPVASDLIGNSVWEAPISRWQRLFSWLAGRDEMRPTPYIKLLPGGADPGREAAADCMLKVTAAVDERRYADAQRLLSSFNDTLTGTQLLHSDDALGLLFLFRSGVIDQRATKEASEALRRKQAEEQQANDKKYDKKSNKK